MSFEESAFVAGRLQASCAAVVMPRFAAVSSSSPPMSETSMATSFLRASVNRCWTRTLFDSQPDQTFVAACSPPSFTSPGLGGSAIRRVACVAATSWVGVTARALVPISSSWASVGTARAAGSVATNATAFGSYSAANRRATSSPVIVGRIRR